MAGDARRDGGRGGAAGADAGVPLGRAGARAGRLAAGRGGRRWRRRRPADCWSGGWCRGSSCRCRGGRPGLWLAIMVLYPFLSALPQELIFRALFFRRYRALFPSERAAVAVNGLVFALAHLMFWNWVAVALCIAGGVIFAVGYLGRGGFLQAVVLHAICGAIVFTSGLGIFFYHGGGGVALSAGAASDRRVQARTRITGCIASKTSRERWQRTLWPGRARERREHGLAEVARHLVLARAAGLEGAAGRRVHRRGDVALEHDVRLLDAGVGDRDGREQRLGVGVVGRLEDLVGGADLDHVAEVHHHHPVGEVAHDAEVVADEEHRGAVCRAGCRSGGRSPRPAPRRRAPRPARRRPPPSAPPAKARAMPMRCFCPPESWRGIRSAKARGSLTRSSSSSIRASRSAFERPTRNFSSARTIWPPDAHARVERVERVLEHHLDRGDGARCRAARSARLADLLVAER